MNGADEWLARIVMLLVLAAFGGVAWRNARGQQSGWQGLVDSARADAAAARSEVSAAREDVSAIERQLDLVRREMRRRDAKCQFQLAFMQQAMREAGIDIEIPQFDQGDDP